MKRYYLCVVLFVLLITGCSQGDENKSKQMQNSMPPVPVGTIIAKKQDVDIALEFPARLESEQNVLIVAKVSGTLMQKYFKDGMEVKKGDKLFLIEQDRYQANYEVAKAALEVAKATQDKAQIDFKRATNLLKTKSISQKEYDGALSEYKIAEAKLLSAKAALRNSELDLNYTIVTAPFDGVIGKNLKDIGSYISLQEPNLARLTKMDPIIANFSFSDIEKLDIATKLKDKIWQANNIEAILNYNNMNFNGKITFIDSVIDSQTGSVEAKAIFNNDNKEILPNTFARIKITGITQKDAFKIPAQAILQGQTNPYVLIIKNSKVEKRDVKVDYQTVDFGVISKGIEENDEIIIDNFKKIRVGSSVVKAGDK